VGISAAKVIFCINLVSQLLHQGEIPRMKAVNNSRRETPKTPDFIGWIELSAIYSPQFFGEQPGA
jgi:hypothetical protein